MNEVRDKRKSFLKIRIQLIDVLMSARKLSDEKKTEKV